MRSQRHHSTPPARPSLLHGWRWDELSVKPATGLFKNPAAARALHDNGGEPAEPLLTGAWHHHRHFRDLPTLPPLRRPPPLDSRPGSVTPRSRIMESRRSISLLQSENSVLYGTFSKSKTATMNATAINRAS